MPDRRTAPFCDLLGVATVTLVAIAAMLVARTIADPDLWGHLRFGADILASGRLATHDPYSFTSDIAWVNHEWLAELIFAALYTALGAFGLTLCKAAIVGTIAAVVWRGARRAGASPFSATLLAASLVVATSTRTLPIRPQLFSLLFFTLLLVIADSIERGHEKAALAIPVVFCLWANSHGGWIVGFGALTVWALWTRRFVLIPAAALATLVNPYGVGLWMFIRDTVGLARPDIADWKPLYQLPLMVIAIECAVPAVAAAAVWYTRRVPPARHLAVLALLAVATVRVGRIDAFLQIAIALVCAPALGAAANAIDQRLRRSGALTRPSLACSAAAVVVTCAAVAFTAYHMARITVVGDWLPDREALEFIRGHVTHARLVTYFDWGEYAIWHLSPNDIQVSMDGRRETVYSDRVLTEHFAFYWNKGADAWQYPDRVGADAVWLPSDLPIIKALRAHGWRPMFESSTSVVLSRDAEPRQVARFVAVSPSTPAVFPGP